MDFRKNFLEMKKLMEREHRMDATINSLVEKLQKIREQRNANANDIANIRQALQDELMVNGLRVKTLQDFKLMNGLWDASFNDFNIEKIHLTTPREVVEMRDIYGQNLEFAYWDKSYEWLSDEIEYFDGVVVSEVGNQDRLNNIFCVTEALIAEKT